MIEQKIKTPDLQTTADFPLTKKNRLRIVFMGTPDFAVASLKKLVESGYDIAGVITAPDKAGGRGMLLQQSAVKKYAVEKGLNVLQPEKLKNPVFLEALRSLHADLQVVVAFRMLPEIVWDMPPLGTVNLHGSLLPQYRGAAPINWAIINGEKKTGITTFKLQQEIDTGNILLSTSIPIGEDESAGELHDKMKETGAELLLATVKGLAEGNLAEHPQTGLSVAALSDRNSEKPLKHAPKIFTDTCRIDWNNPLAEVYNLIRGLSPYPTAFTMLEDKQLKIFKAEKVNKEPAIPTGKFETDKKTFLQFACIDGYISVNELQLEGKTKMKIQDFLRGYRWP